MIFVRFKSSLRDRLPEWISAIAMFLWGLILITEPANIVTSAYFSVLFQIMPQLAWGSIAIIAGTIRILSLFINGYWRPTAHLRAVGAFLGTTLWGSLIISYLSLPWTPPAVAAKFALFLTDAAALWFAASDAKLADIAANDKVKNGG